MELEATCGNRQAVACGIAAAQGGETALDTLTQFALGAVVGHVALAQRQEAPALGRWALLWGGLLGTLPDLDVFIPMGGPVADFTYHRSWSHSLFVLALLAVPLAALLRRLHPATTLGRGQALAGVYACFATHVLLDSFTVYGTQILWPISSHPMSWSTLFIIDPAYTLPLLAAIIAVLLLRSNGRLAQRWTRTALALTSAYLVWSVGAKLWVESQARAALLAQGIAYDRLMSTPAPFNTLLWRVVAMAPDARRYHVAWISVLDGHAPVRLRRHGRQAELLEPLSAHWPVARLRWFTHGFYRVDRIGDAIVMTDLRMGMEGRYVFRFQVGEMAGGRPRPTADVQLPGLRRADGIGAVFARITDPGVDLPPPCAPTVC